MPSSRNITRPSADAWTPRQGGACADGSPRTFFPDMYDDDAPIEVPSRVRELCQLDCPFYKQCLEWAIANDAYGFWAATSRYQRLQLDRTRQRARCPVCRSDAIAIDPYGQTCIACGMSWLIN